MGASGCGVWGEPELILAALLVYLAPEVGVVWESEFDSRGLAAGAVHEERVGS